MLAQARAVDDFRMRVKVLKEKIEENFYDPVFGCITHQAVVDELNDLLLHFGLSRTHIASNKEISYESYPFGVKGK